MLWFIAAMNAETGKPKISATSATENLSEEVTSFRSDIRAHQCAKFSARFDSVCLSFWCADAFCQVSWTFDPQEKKALGRILGVIAPFATSKATVIKPEGAAYRCLATNCN